MKLHELKEQVYQANMMLPEYGLAPFTWGNASAVDREQNLFVIKPSGVAYSELTAEKMVAVSLEDGSVIDSQYRPSSDTPTHLILYRMFPGIGGVVHTHSRNAAAFAQAGRDIPAYGTTHADFAFGDIPCTDALTDEEINGDYESNTGLVISRCFQERGIDPLAVPGVLVRNHGPFTWGADAAKAAENAAVLEIVAEMALKTELLAGDGGARVGQTLLAKHYLRKHGKNAYYGQK